MRSYEEIRADVRPALNARDLDATRALAREMEQDGSELGIAWSILLEGQIERVTGSAGEALKKYQKAAETFRTSNDPDGYGITLNASGNCLEQLGQNQKAQEYFEKAIEWYENIGDLAGVGRSLANLATLFVDIGDLDQAMEYADQAMDAALDAKDAVVQSNVGLAIGNILTRQGKIDEAVAQYERIRDADLQRGDLHSAAITDGNLAVVYRLIGDMATSLAHSHRALAVFQELNDPSATASIFVGLGSLYAVTGQYPEALSYYQKALEAAVSTGNMQTATIAVGNMGHLYLIIGDLAQAERMEKQTLEQAIEIGNPGVIANCYQNLGVLEIAKHDIPKAIEYFHEARALFQSVGHEAQLFDTDIELVQAFILLGDLDRALALESDLRESGSRVGASWSYHHNVRGQLALVQGKLDEARSSFQRSLEIATAAGLPLQQSRSHEALRSLAEKTNDLAAYIEHNKQYLKITEEINGKDTSVRLAMIAKEHEIMEERVQREKERSLLYGALPESVANRMLAGEDVTGDHYSGVSVLFLDIVGFTSISDRIPPGHVVHLLEQIFSELDDVVEKHGVTKIKTIGDSYMAVAGVPEPLTDHAQRAAACAVDMLKTLADLQITMPPELGDTSWVNDVGEINVRIGLHCGPVTAGVIGTKRLQYDVWGDTVNVASRMESTGEPGRIQCSEAFAQLLSSAAVAERDGTAISNSHQQLRERGAVEVKGKGTMTTYWLEGA